MLDSVMRQLEEDDEERVPSGKSFPTCRVASAIRGLMSIGKEKLIK